MNVPWSFAMVAAFQRIEALPRRNATQVKNKWSDLVRQVRASGSVAVTNHDQIEMVVVEAGTYREMTALVEGAEARREATLAELTAEFDRRLATFAAPDAHARMDAKIGR